MMVYKSKEKVFQTEKKRKAKQIIQSFKNQFLKIFRFLIDAGSGNYPKFYKNLLENLKLSRHRLKNGYIFIQMQ